MKRAVWKQSAFVEATSSGVARSIKGDEPPNLCSMRSSWPGLRCFQPTCEQVISFETPPRCGDVSWCVMLLCICSGAGYLLRRIKPNLDGVCINPQTSRLCSRRFRWDVKTDSVGFLSLFLHAITAMIESHITLRFTSEGRRLMPVWESSGRLILRGLTWIN